MKKVGWKGFIACLTISLLACTILDFLLVLLSVTIRNRTFILFFLVSFFVLLFMYSHCRKPFFFFFKLNIIVFLIGAMIFGFLNYSNNTEVFNRLTGYREVAMDKAELFAGKRVMLIVPHEDDDLNILGGIIDQYIRYGSEFSVVFMFNGDYYIPGEERIAESLALYESIGVPEESVIFLGYSDQLKSEGKYLFNALDDAEAVAENGHDKTYGTETHPAYRNNQKFTKANLKQNLKEVILQIRPDVIFCADYDMNVDHKACSMFFESVMGEILMEYQEYEPIIFKGFAYSTAWDAEKDYFVPNIHATQNAYSTEIRNYSGIYPWEERIRMPVVTSALNRSLSGSTLYQQLRFYSSQNAVERAAALINGDKVFWKRATDSLCKTAMITASSGDAIVLNDFQLLYTEDLVNLNHFPFDGVWAPSADDSEKTVEISFPMPYDIKEIVLYDNPSETDNILDAEIQFSHDVSIRTGALEPHGIATRIPVDQIDVSSFTIRLTETEGERAGLTELEVFQQKEKDNPSWIKLKTGEEDFVYDYIIDPSGTETFFLYSDGELPVLDDDVYTVTCDQTACDVKMKNGTVTISCPRRKACTVTVTEKNTGLSDSVYIRNPSKCMRGFLWLYQRFEAILYGEYHQLHAFKIQEAVEYARYHT